MIVTWTKNISPLFLPSHLVFSSNFENESDIHGEVSLIAFILRFLAWIVTAGSEALAGGAAEQTAYKQNIEYQDHVPD